MVLWRQLRHGRRNNERIPWIQKEDKKVKISIDSAIYLVNQGEADEKFRPRGEASDQDVAVMLEALRIVQRKRPKMMEYVKLYKVSFVQLRTNGGKLGGQKTAIPYFVVREYKAEGREETLQMSENGSKEGACLCLPLTSANAIASWIVKHLDRHVHSTVHILKRDMEMWEGVATEADPWPYTAMEFPNYAFGEMPPGRYETDFRDKTDLKKIARLEIQPYNGQLRVRIIDGHPMRHGTNVLSKGHLTLLSADPGKLIEDLLYEELQFE